jgi:23S rRNA U2552 (ribose-2'-O)-methylase RlmE/FtsJ
MDILKKHVLKLSHNELDDPKIMLEISENIAKQDFDLDIYKLIKKYKDEIDNISNPKIWDFSKKLSNMFEMIHINNKGKTNNLGIANYDPISRSYFKMWEMITDLNLIDFQKKKLNVVCLAEGPGGFVECICNMRKKYSNYTDDSITCMTLRSYRNVVPGWNKSGKIFRENKGLRIFYGKDDTGDLYKSENIISLKNLVKSNKADLVTADGGFDFSMNYNHQEQLSLRLLIVESISALACLNEGGHYVLKIFDIHTKLTVKLIYFLTIYFKNVYITKPFTSRPANSEKYIVCKNFIGVSEKYLNELIYLVSEWEILDEQNKLVQDIFPELSVPVKFQEGLKLYNRHLASIQIKNILKTLCYINLSIENNHINHIKQNQAIVSSLWCHKYNLPINIKCKFLKDNIEHYNYIPNFMNY